MVAVAMVDKDRWYRSRNALAGGVCAGIADRLSVDALVVRICAVILACMTAGLVAIFYGGLWLLLPLAPEMDVPCDVVPQSVQSEAYGTTFNGCESARLAGDSCSERGWFFVDLEPIDDSGTAHLPPAPPGPLAWADSSRILWSGGIRCDSARIRELEKSMEKRVMLRRRHLHRVVAAVTTASLVLSAVVASVLGTYVDGVESTECWPLLLSILGIIRLVVPSVPGRRALAFVAGIVLFFSGTTLFVMTTDIVNWTSLAYMIRDLWVLLALVAVMLAYGIASGSHGWVVAAGLGLVAFFVAGLLWCSIPGETESLVLSVPGGFVRHFILPAING